MKVFGLICLFVCLFFQSFLLSELCSYHSLYKFFYSPTLQGQAVCRLVSKNEMKYLCFAQFLSEQFKFGGGSCKNKFVKAMFC